MGSALRRYASVLLRNSSGEIVLQERRVRNRTIVTTFGGGVEPGEADADAARREIREELGLTLAADLVEPLVALLKFETNELIHCQYYVYLKPVDVSELVLTEGDRVLILPQSDVVNPRVPITPVARVALEQFMRWMRNAGPLSEGSPKNSGFVQAYAQNRCLTALDAYAWINVLKEHCSEQRSCKPRRVLDLGSGTGRFLSLLRFALNASMAVGVDASLAMASRTVLTAHDAVCADAASLPFASNAFDVVWSFLVWHQLKDSDAACRETFRVLADSGGQFLLRTAFTDEESTGALFDYFPSARRIQMNRYQAKKDIFRSLAAAGFAEIYDSRLEIPVTSSFAEYVEKVRSRAYSILWALPEGEYLSGLRQMEDDLRRGKTGPVSLPCDLVVATKGDMR
ncbi:MAG TPA: methyltransferase domain-containing protein [Thermoanaerobaculia bacterium]|jgi:SAM-dependent methyltransferase|nr:methyltransferase domain-containing protein [Thermoanaerobaculia bacterium]